MLDRLSDLVAFCRDFPLTAPAVAAIDTIVRLVSGNVRAFLAEPWVVVAAVFTATNEATGGGITSANWKAWLGAYALAFCRYFTVPHFEDAA